MYESILDKFAIEVHDFKGLSQVHHFKNQNDPLQARVVKLSLLK